MKKIFLLLALVLIAACCWAQTLPYQNPALSSAERAKDLVPRLTLEEKATLMCDESQAIPRLGIKKFNWWSEALHGLANNDSVTVFPEPIGMAASFDDALVYRVFNAASDETRAKYHDWIRKGNENKRFLSLSVWTPNVNIFRDPRWGRGQETYGEDPYLTSRMGVAVVKGLQGPADAKYRKLLACGKHYAVHSGPEWNRHTLNLNNVDPRDLYETYLPAFKALVQQADVREIMCAYQRLDDDPCCGNSRLLQSILRDQWGFKHLVVSDCGAINDFYMNHKSSSDATHAASKAVLAGTDVECVGYAFKSLPDAVGRGLVSETEINKHVQRLLEGRFELGEMDPDAIVPWASTPMSVVNCDAHKQLALEMARKAMTLLQNKNGVLPLSKDLKKIAVVGPNADDAQMLWGNYNGTPFKTITILDGVQEKLGAAKVVHARACDLVENAFLISAVGECSLNGKPGITSTFWKNREMTGTPVITQSTVHPVKQTTFGAHEFGSGVPLEGFSGKYETVFRPTASGEIVFKMEVCGAGRLSVNGDTIGRVYMWRALPKRIPYKVEKGKEYRIVLDFQQIENWTATVNLDFGREVPVTYDGLLATLKGVDVVVFAGGLSPLVEGEEMPVELPGFKGGDRTNIELPDVQRNTLKALKQAGKKVIFVNCSGSALALTPETESCDAILQAWYPGESGGRAVADVLFGDVNPSGKLPVTFYKNSDQLPGFEDYAMKGRTYRFMADPLFPFGFGLSYTTFSLGKATLSKSDIASSESVKLVVPVKNTGSREGTEVVQVYVRKANDPHGPLKTLRGFERVTLAAGASHEVSVTLPPVAFEFYDRASGTMMVAPGAYEVLYGNSSDARDLKQLTVTVH